MKPSCQQMLRWSWLIAGALASWASASPERLVIRSARDPGHRFVERSDSPLQRRVLAWDHGLVATPDDLAWLAEGDADLAFDLQADELSAMGVAGSLPLTPGRFDLDTPLLLSDGRLDAFLVAGHLEILEDRLIYRPPGRGIARGGTMFILAGVAVGTAVLLRAVRRRQRRL